MAKEKQYNKSVECARKCIDTILEAFNINDALIIICNDDEYQGEIFGNEYHLAQNIRIGMEQNNIVSNRLKKLIDILTLLK